MTSGAASSAEYSRRWLILGVVGIRAGDGDSRHDGGQPRVAVHAAGAALLKRRPAVLVSDTTAVARAGVARETRQYRVTTQYVADVEAIKFTAVNSAVPPSSEPFGRVSEAVADARIVVLPITRVTLEEVPAALCAARPGRGQAVM